ncbi:MAG: hypothetical protein K9N07_08495 [Candidatus Cloacimonetes bacterium]|nr:hypothetical protein [Candidatus Cloacimonadota bacterium]
MTIKRELGEAALKSIHAFHVDTLNFSEVKYMKLYNELFEQLKLEPNYISDNGELKKWVVINKAQNFDPELIELLLDNIILKENFFVKIKEVLVFNQSLFIQFLE